MLDTQIIVEQRDVFAPEMTDEEFEQCQFNDLGETNDPETALLVIQKHATIRFGDIASAYKSLRKGDKENRNILKMLAEQGDIFRKSMNYLASEITQPKTRKTKFILQNLPRKSFEQEFKNKTWQYTL